MPVVAVAAPPHAAAGTAAGTDAVVQDEVGHDALLLLPEVGVLGQPLLVVLLAEDARRLGVAEQQRLWLLSFRLLRYFGGS